MGKTFNPEDLEFKEPTVSLKPESAAILSVSAVVLAMLLEAPLAESVMRLMQIKDFTDTQKIVDAGEEAKDAFIENLTDASRAKFEEAASDPEVNSDIGKVFGF